MEDNSHQKSISIIIPARNEQKGLTKLLPEIRSAHPDAEIIVIDDGSTDATAEVARNNGARVISHPYAMGNGAAVKTGSRHADGDVLVFLDGDGQHDPADIATLLAKLNDGFDMVVAARGASSQASLGRRLANGLYNRMASWMVGRYVADLTSGFRAVDAVKFKEFVYLLPNGFSYPTTITMSFFRAGYLVGYIPIHARVREGKSHIRPLHDGMRFLLIIFKVGVLYSPLKVFLPVSLVFFVMGLGYYAYTLVAFGRFTNMSALLFSTSTLVFLMGLISEQITSLLYSKIR